MSKKRLLIFPFNLLSHYLRCIALAGRYRDWEVLFAHSDKYSSYVEAAGYTTFTVEAFDADSVMEQAARFSFDWLNAADIKRVYLSQAEAIRRLKPQLVIGDTAPTLKMSAEATNTPYTALMNGYMSKYYDGLRELPRTHAAYTYMQQLPPWLGACIIRMAEKGAFRSVHKPFRELRARHGLKRVHSYLDELEGDENLICDRPDLFPLKNAPANYEVIGPLMHRTSGDEQELLAALDPGKPTVCVCLGSSGRWDALSFLSEPMYNCLNIVAAGDAEGVLKGAHIFNRRFVNLDQVLPSCSFLICHGGNGTVYEGLRHNKHMLCLTSHFEQEWNVNRLEALGLGRSVNDDPRSAIHAQLKMSCDLQLS